jgi:hemolysin D
VFLEKLLNTARRHLRAKAEAIRDAATADIIRQFQSETDAIREAPEPRWARITVLTLAALLLSMLIAMILTRLDRVVTSIGGKIVATQPINVFQALDPSIIRSLDVREGDEVQQGQLLATLDPTFAAADVKQLSQQIASLEAQVARDEAQLDEHPLVIPQQSDPELVKYAVLQKGFYDQQVAQYKAQLTSFDAKIAQTRATIQKFQTDQSRYRDREEIARKIEDMRLTLAQHGTGSQYNLWTSQDQRLELLRTIEFGYNSLVEAQHTLASLTADREAYIQQWSTQLSQDLVTARNNLDTARAQLDKAAKHQDLVSLTATESSVVLTMAKLSIGSVLKQGDTLFTLMPADTAVEAEIRISSKEIGFLRPGDHCVLKIDAFNHMEHGTAEGSVRWISDNAFTLDDDGKPVDPYYRARCSVDAMMLRNVPPKFRLIPGMTLEADLKVGTRSVAVYLLSGIMRGFSEAMREP